MRKKSLTGWMLLVIFLLLNLNSCSSPRLSPTETVGFYLEEMGIFRDPFYKEAALDKLKENSDEAKRYLTAVKTIDRLIWTDKDSLFPKRRRNTLMTIGAIITSDGYEIIDERTEDNKAFVTVIFEKTTLFNLDLGKASQEDSPPATYELIRTRRGWQIKDINGILAKRGF